MLKTQKTTFFLKISILKIIQQSKLEFSLLGSLIMYFCRLRFFNLKDDKDNMLTATSIALSTSNRKTALHFSGSINTESLWLKRDSQPTARE